MKKARDDKAFPRHHQLPLGFSRTDPGDLKRVLAFLDNRSPEEPPALLSEVFSRFSEQPEAWSGGKIAGIISSLFSDRMISCRVNGTDFPHPHAGVFLEAFDLWGQIRVIPRKRLTSGELSAIADTCQRIFGQRIFDRDNSGMACPQDQDDLILFLVNCLKQWETSLAAYGRLAETGQYPGTEDIRSCRSFVKAWLAIPDPYQKICAFRDMKADLMSFADTFARLKDFYENGISRWESWQKAMEKFTVFRAEMDEDPHTAACLSRLRQILAMQNPWDDLNGVDALIARIKPVYARIRDERSAWLQHETLLQINRMIETISGLLDNVHAQSAVRNTALVELQKIKQAIEHGSPDSLISRHLEIAEEAFEKAQDIVFSQG